MTNLMDQLGHRYWAARASNTTSPKGVSSKRRRYSSAWLAWFGFLLVLTIWGLSTAYEDEYSGLRTYWRRHLGHYSLSSVPMGYSRLAKQCFKHQSEKANAIFNRILAHDQEKPRASSPKRFDVCPVILSTIERQVPHWVWTAASLMQGHDETHDVTFGPPTVVWRGEAVFGGMGNVDLVHKIRELERRNLLRMVVTTSERNMPAFERFQHLVFASLAHENAHFAKQAFDHVFAMQDCEERECSLCIVLEDDLVISSTWRRRVEDAFKQLHMSNWGVLKLFELEEKIRVADPVEGWESGDIPTLLAAALATGTGLTLIMYTSLRRHTTIHQRRLCGMWAGLILWSLVLLALLGSSFLFPPVFPDPAKLRSQPTSFRKSRVPIRGAVANMYRLEDLSPIADTVRDHIRHLTGVGDEDLGQSRLDWLDKFGDTFIYSSDLLRIDVIVAKYCMFTKRPILILEPNVVQHIGFVSTEPLRSAPFTAMSSTFEDVLYDETD